MPYITKKVQSEIIDLNGTKTLIIDYEKTRELELNETKSNLSFEEIKELKEKFAGYQNLSRFLNNLKVGEIENQINEIEAFYEILWNRTRIELIFLTNWYTQELINPQSFEIIAKGNDDFLAWYTNNVKYNILNKVRNFYMKLAEFYANKVSIDIYEKDVEVRSKMVIEDIEDAYLEEIRDYLNYEWEKAFEYHRDVYSKKQAERRKTILFE